MIKSRRRLETSETEPKPSQTRTLSDFLRQFIDANPDQLIGGEAAEEWVMSLWKVRNPAAKLKKSLDNFLAIFEPSVGPTVIALRKAIEPLTK